MRTDERLNVPELPPDVFEALVDAWADLLVADYQARHTAAPETSTHPQSAAPSYDALAPAPYPRCH